MRGSTVRIFAWSLLSTSLVEAKEWRGWTTSFSPAMYESGEVMEKIMETKMASEYEALTSPNTDICIGTLGGYGATRTV